MNRVPAFPLSACGLHPDARTMSAEVRVGLRHVPKRAASKYFYDARGSQLFELICEQPEYYLTRVELALMRERVGEIAAVLGERVRLVEFGSGSGVKTRLLLRHLSDPAAYVPIEMSGAALQACVQAVAADLPQLQVLPLYADFTSALALPKIRTPPARTVVYFPGSTIGNFETGAAIQLLRQMRRLVGRGGAALIGADLRKDSGRIEAAYNDAAGVTAQFTLNMLARFNRELGADFDLGSFVHRARYNALAGRIETHLVSARAQQVHIDGEAFDFGAGEALLTEYSYKYSLEGFARMAQQAGFTVERVWTDAERQFSVQYLV